MFLFLKLLKPFVLPPTLIAVGMAAALVFVVRSRKRWAMIALAMTLSSYYLLAIEPTSAALAWTLEHRYARSMPRVLTAHNFDAIVVLAGGASHPPGLAPELSGASWRRLWKGIALHRALGGTLPIIYSGGSGDPFDPVSREAELAQQYATDIGIDPRQFWIEHASRNTYENGVETKHFLEQRFPDASRFRILLVTSAWHLPRAVGVFERLGFDVTPIAADILSGTPTLDPLSFFPSADAFSASVAGIHEWVGMLSYRLLGRM